MTDLINGRVCLSVFLGWDFRTHWSLVSSTWSLSSSMTSWRLHGSRQENQPPPATSPELHSAKGRPARAGSRRDAPSRGLSWSEAGSTLPATPLLRLSLNRSLLGRGRGALTKEFRSGSPRVVRGCETKRNDRRGNRVCGRLAETGASPPRRPALVRTDDAVRGPAAFE